MEIKFIKAQVFLHNVIRIIESHINLSRLDKKNKTNLPRRRNVKFIIAKPFFHVDYFDFFGKEFALILYLYETFEV